MTEFECIFQEERNSEKKHSENFRTVARKCFEKISHLPNLFLKSFRNPDKILVTINFLSKFKIVFFQKTIRNSKRYYREKFRKTVERKCFGIMFHFLSYFLKPVEIRENCRYFPAIFSVFLNLFFFLNSLQYSKKNYRKISNNCST